MLSKEVMLEDLSSVPWGSSFCVPKCALSGLQFWYLQILQMAIFLTCGPAPVGLYLTCLMTMVSRAACIPADRNLVQGSLRTNVPYT